MPQDAPVALQQDNVAPVPGTGAGIRTVLVTVMVNNVPTQVAMQAVAIADSDGHTIDFATVNQNQILIMLLQETRQTNAMLSVLSGIPYEPDLNISDNTALSTSSNPNTI